MTTHTEGRPTMIVTGPGTGEPACDMEYVRSISGILKIIEIILDIVVLIASSVWGSVGGWVVFVALSCFLTTLIMLIFHCISLFNRYVGLFFFEFLSYIIMAVFYFVSAILTVIYAAKYGHGSIIASCLFTIVTMIVYSIDTYMHFVGWKQSRLATYSQPQASAL